MDSVELNGVVFDHVRDVKGEASLLREKARGLRIVGMDSLARDIEFACDMIEGKADDLREAWGNYGKDEFQRSQDSVGETLKAFADTLGPQEG